MWQLIEANRKGGATNPTLFFGLALKYAWKSVPVPSFQPPVLAHFLGLSKNLS